MRCTCIRSSVGSGFRSDYSFGVLESVVCEIAVCEEGFAAFIHIQVYLLICSVHEIRVLDCKSIATALALIGSDGSGVSVKITVIDCEIAVCNIDCIVFFFASVSDKLAVRYIDLTSTACVRVVESGIYCRAFAVLNPEVFQCDGGTLRADCRSGVGLAILNATVLNADFSALDCEYRSRAGLGANRMAVKINDYVVMRLDVLVNRNILEDANGSALAVHCFYCLGNGCKLFSLVLGDYVASGLKL